MELALPPIAGPASTAVCCLNSSCSSYAAALCFRHPRIPYTAPTSVNIKTLAYKIRLIGKGMIFRADTSTTTRATLDEATDTLARLHACY